jgi:hypothetical protein
VFGSPKDLLDFYRKEIQYETAILTNRTDAYLAAQSFLIIAYVMTIANENPDWGKLFTLVVPLMFAILGFVTSVHAWPGIKSAYEIIDHWHFKQHNLLQNEPEMGNAYDDSPLFSKRESSEKGLPRAAEFFHEITVDFQLSLVIARRSLCCRSFLWFTWLRAGAPFSSEDCLCGGFIPQPETQQELQRRLRLPDDR